QRTGGADPSPQFGAALTISFPETAGGSTTVFAVMRAVERFVTRCAPDEPGTLAPKGTGRIAAVPTKAHEATLKGGERWRSTTSLWRESLLVFASWPLRKFGRNRFPPIATPSGMCAKRFTAWGSLPTFSTSKRRDTPSCRRARRRR